MAAGNTLWKVKDPSEGFWRRNVIIEWPVQFPDDNDATSLALEKELSGIFTWLVRQAVLYAQYGMPPVPESARARTAEYRDNEDDLAEWIEERLVVAEGATLDRTEARNDYYAWCRSNGIKQSDQLSTTDFGSEMARKFKVARPRTTDAEGKRPRVYKDLALRLMEAAPAPGSAPLAVVTMGDIL
jgi:phage/plasmid-associated DNA primase